MTLDDLLVVATALKERHGGQLPLGLSLNGQLIDQGLTFLPEPITAQRSDGTLTGMHVLIIKPTPTLELQVNPD